MSGVGVGGAAFCAEMFRSTCGVVAVVSIAAVVSGKPARDLKPTLTSEARSAEAATLASIRPLAVTSTGGTRAVVSTAAARTLLYRVRGLKPTLTSEAISEFAAIGAVEIFVSTSPPDEIGSVATLRSILGLATRDLRPTLTSEAISAIGAVGDADILVSTCVCGVGSGRNLGYGLILWRSRTFVEMSAVAAIGEVEIFVSISALDAIGAVDALRSICGARAPAASAALRAAVRDVAALDLRPTLTSEAISPVVAIGAAEIFVSISPLDVFGFDETFRSIFGFGD